MPAIAQLLLRYVLVGISTALLVTFAPTTDTSHVDVTASSSASLPAAIPYQSPVETLEFLFESTDQATSSQSAVPELEPAPQSAPKPVLVPAPSEPSLQADILSDEDAVVNIICTEMLGNITRTTTGSGVIISSDGLIITNAHVAIDLTKGSTCTIRTGTVARNAYKAEAVYIPEAWIERNRDYIASGIRGITNGEYDFALLQIVGSATAARFPASFPFIRIDTEELSAGDDVEVIGYPAERVSLFSSLSNLFRVSDDARITKIYSFGETEVDVISTSKVSHAEQGVSGGAVIKDDMLVAIAANVNSGSINALSLAYVKAYFEKDTRFSFDSLLK